ncbi:PLD nuclease N-terminal domain-containing protein [Ktedonospora formicarum]|uniref:Cardiolipin synthase N-terminal domain-containing protein n=1 Tax=Ktedonospora formicarum TaxID=2778364 RepID=A0A8J3MSM4_9CHLR|nr:PLD nuclease N-terminal domain-containing protein [Ktedonospora formicarum]GHO43490.1 hypothetical protein KSX_16530 [Ktedonospora formicarum]
MNGSRGCFFNTVLFLICVFLPVVSHIIETVMIWEDEHSPMGKLVWLLIVWLIPIVGSLLYLLIGQRPPSGNYIRFAQPSRQA